MTGGWAGSPLLASLCQRFELSRGKVIKAGGGREHSEKGEFLNCLGSLKPQGGMAERTNATVLKTVRPFAGSRGFKSHSLRQMLLSLEMVVDYLYGMDDGDA